MASFFSNLFKSKSVVLAKNDSNVIDKSINMVLLSDLHLEFWEDELFSKDVNLLHFLGYKEEDLEKTDLFVICGDLNAINFSYNSHLKSEKFLEYCLSYSKPVLFVSGNHEYYKTSMEEVDRYYQQLAEFKINKGFDIYNNFHYLLNEYIDLTINDLPIRFFGSTFWTSLQNTGNDILNNNWHYDQFIIQKHNSINDTKIVLRSEQTIQNLISQKIAKITEINNNNETQFDLAEYLDELQNNNKFSIFAHMNLFKIALEKFIEAYQTKENRYFVVLSHHLPTQKNIQDVFPQYMDGKHFFYASSLEDYLVAKNINPEYWCHGHWHKSSSQYQFSNNNLSTQILTNIYGYRRKPNNSTLTSESQNKEIDLKIEENINEETSINEIENQNLESAIKTNSTTEIITNENNPNKENKTTEKEKTITELDKNQLKVKQSTSFQPTLIKLNF